MVEHNITFIHVIIVIAISAYTIWQTTMKSNIPNLRQLPQLLAIDECIGRCVEMGRPVLFTVGGVSTSSSWGVGPALAGFAILQDTATKCIEKGAELIVSITAPDHLPIIQSMLQEAYAAGGNPEGYNEDDLVFVGGSQYSQTAALLGIMDEQNPAGFIFPGGTGWSRVIYGEHAAKIGAMSIAGINNTYQIPYTVPSYDYTLICEDFLAAGAMITQEPMAVANVWSGDLYRFLLIAMILLGVIASLIGIDVGGFFSV